MVRELTWREAIDKVLGAAATPLHYKEIATKIIAGGLRISVGATPAATVNARISSSMKYDSPSPYVRVGKGMLALASNVTTPVAPTAEMAHTNERLSDISEQPSDLVTSFGLCWHRDAIRWSAAPRLLGMKQLRSTSVDFNKQAGIYLLCDGREIVYIGHAVDRRLGQQLLGHTHDRLASRWDRFSWFGLLPVAADGQLGALPTSYDTTTAILGLQTILVEALEPRQIRRHVDELSTLEFIQREDPELKRGRGSKAQSRPSWKRSEV